MFGGKLETYFEGRYWFFVPKTHTKIINIVFNYQIGESESHLYGVYFSKSI